MLRKACLSSASSEQIIRGKGNANLGQWANFILPQAGLNTMLRYVRKAVEEQATKTKVVSSPVKKTPRKKQRQPKTKQKKTTSKSQPEEMESDTTENVSEPEVFSGSEVGEELITDENKYNNLGELESEITIEIDPRSISLSIETQPLVMLSLLRKIECLEKRQFQLEEENEGLKKTVEFSIEKIKDLEIETEKCKKEVENTKIEINNVTTINNMLREDSNKLKEKSLKAESYSRRNNLRFEGIPHNPNETPEDCRNKIYSILVNEFKIHDAEARIVIDRCHRDSRYPNTNPPSILVRFLSYRDRDEIWQKKDHLNRNTRNKLFVNQDFPPEVEKKRAFLRPYLKAAYSTGNKAVLVGDQIMVNAKKYTVDELDQLPEAMGPDKVALKEDQGTLLFYRSDAYMSNFHKSSLTVNNIKYNCVEQYFTVEKARCFRDVVTIDKIMKSEKPSEMKFLTRNITGFNQSKWDEIAATTMLTGLRAKFTQNSILKDKLIATKDLELAEASKNDRVWGIGMSVTDPTAFDKKNWQGKNQLGNLLMKVRDELQRNNNNN